MFTAPTTSGPRLRVVCQDNRLMELCDQNVITAIFNHLSAPIYFDSASLLAAASVLRRIEGQLTVVEFCAFIENHPELTVGLIALTQDGVSSFDSGLGNFLDIGSGFDSGMLFITKDRFEAVWQFLSSRGVSVPNILLHYYNWDMNIFGESGLWIKPVHLAMDGNTINA